MITSKELQYVEHWASKIPMPGVDYSTKVLNELKECYDIYNEIYKDKEYNFIFSNGEEIEFEILTKNLCHMLGIDFPNIKCDFFEPFRKKVLGIKTNSFSSYELLEMIIDKADKIIENDNDVNSKQKAINYYKTGIKCGIFKKLSNFDKFNFAAINYNAGGEKAQTENKKYFFVPSNEAVCPYFMIGVQIDEERMITVDNDMPKYFVNTLLAPKNPKTFFENQEVVIPTQILVSDNDKMNRMVATPTEKIQLLTMYKSIINAYNIPNKMNIYGDYENMLNEQSTIERVKILK